MEGKRPLFLGNNTKKKSQIILKNLKIPQREGWWTVALHPSHNRRIRTQRSTHKFTGFIGRHKTLYFNLLRCYFVTFFGKYAPSI